MCIRDRVIRGDQTCFESCKTVLTPMIFIYDLNSSVAEVEAFPPISALVDEWHIREQAGFVQWQTMTKRFQIARL